MQAIRRAAAVTAAAGILVTGFIAASPAMAGNAPQEVRDYPYCELIPDTVANGVTTEHVFNTLGFNDCPKDQWSTITEQSVIDAYNAQYGGGAVAATLNGRRHWVMDTIKSDGGNSSSTDTLTVNGMELGLKALLTVPAGADTIGTNAYAPSIVQRNTTYVFKAGRKVYELIDPKKNVYVMQSYTDYQAPLTLKKLDYIGKFNQLPEGWKYRVRTLKKDLTLTAAGNTTIVNDYFRNTYQINPAAKG